MDADTRDDTELELHDARGVGREAATTQYPLPGGAIGRLGEWLVRRGVIDRRELFTALDASFRHRCRLGDALVWLELVDRGRLEREASRFERYRARPACPPAA